MSQAGGPLLRAPLKNVQEGRRQVKGDLGLYPSPDTPLHPLAAGSLHPPLLSVLRASPGEWVAGRLSPTLAPRTWDSRKPSQVQPSRAASFPGLCWSQVLLSPRTQDKERWRGRLRLVGWGNILGVPQADPISPPEPHIMAFLWVVLGFSLFGSSFGKCKAQAGLAAPGQASPILWPPHPEAETRRVQVLMPLTSPAARPPSFPSQPPWAPLPVSPLHCLEVPWAPRT